MTRPDQLSPDVLLSRIHDGDRGAIDRLLPMYRHHLRLLARLQVSRRLQGKVDPSDLVQDTLMEAQRSIHGFSGSTEGEFVCWLQRILASRTTDLLCRFYGARQRDVRLERRLDEEMDHSSRISQALIQSADSPSELAVRHEQAVLVSDALGQLPAEYEEVITLRHFEELSFPEVAQRMHRSVDSVKGLWVRALATLRRSLGVKGDG